MRKIMYFFLIFVFIFSVYQLGAKQWDYYKERVVYDEIKVMAYTKNNQNNPLETSYSKLKRINEDYQCWIQIEDTNIDYPVVQISNNDYYLTHDFNKNPSKNGTIFLDYRNDLYKDSNLIIYGHNMRDKTMFQALEQFKNREFFSQNSKIFLTDSTAERQYEVFSVYVTPADSTILMNDFLDDEAYGAYLDKAISLSLYESSVKPTIDDQILTLWTCSYEYTDARTIVHAKLME
ncbi:MAG: class B sortase [Turicibacter sp.]